MNKLEKLQLHEEDKKLLEVLRMNKQIYNLLEKCREEIENLYGRDTELTDEITDMMEKLEQQLTNGWIPVSERLPEENGHYLVTYHEWGKGEYLPEFDFACVKILRFYHGEFKMPVCCNDKIEQDIGREVVAWQSLPDPYKELATDNNVVTKSGKDNNALTIGDKIRESNRSLAYMLGSLCSPGATDIKTFEMRGWMTKKWLDYLNQPYME